MARLVEVWCSFRAPKRPEQVWTMKNRFYVINLDKVTYHMESASNRMHNCMWLIKFYYGHTRIHVTKVYSKEMALDMLRYLDEFSPKKEHGSFDFDGEEVDVDDVVMIANKFNNTATKESSWYTLVVQTEDKQMKKTSNNITMGRDAIREVQKEFIR